MRAACATSWIGGKDDVFSLRGVGQPCLGGVGYESMNVVIWIRQNLSLAVSLDSERDYECMNVVLHAACATCWTEVGKMMSFFPYVVLDNHVGVVLVLPKRAMGLARNSINVMDVVLLFLEDCAICKQGTKPVTGSASSKLSGKDWTSL